MTATPFVGRRRETEELRAGLDRALSGRGQLFLISGEPGIGKTRLAEQLALEARGRGAQVAQGRCWEAGGAPAFWPWVQVLRACLQRRAPTSPLFQTVPAGSRIARLVPELSEEPGTSLQAGHASARPAATPLSAEEPQAERFRLFDAVGEFFKIAAEQAPLIIGLEDIHAADADSLLFLQFLAREMHAFRSLLIVTYREAEARLTPHIAQLIGELSREGQSIRLRGISETDVREFVELSACRKPDPATIAALYRVTEGNPFFLTEIVHLLIAEGELKTGSSLLAPLKIPDQVRGAIRRRLDQLPETTKGLLSQASVIGREFDVNLLGRLVGQSAEQLIDSLEGALSSGLLNEMPEALGRYGFSHSLISQTLYDNLSGRRRRALHGRIASALEELHQSDPEPYLSEIAHHQVHSLPPGDAEKAVEYARRAADRAQALTAYEEAARLYRMALRGLELEDPPDLRARCEILLALGDTSYKAGLFEESRSAFKQAADLARHLGNTEQLASAVLGIGVLPTDPGIVDRDLVGLLEEAGNAIGQEDSALHAMVLARLAWELHWSDDEGRRESLSRRAVEIARRVGDTPTLIYVLFNRHLAVWGPDNLEDRLAIATETVRLCDESKNRLWAPRTRYLLLTDLFELGQIAAMDQELQAHAREAQAAWLPLAYEERALAVRALMEGRFDEGERLAERALAAGQRLKRRARFAFISYMAALRREQGRIGEMEAVLGGIVARWPNLRLTRCQLCLCYCDLGRKAEANLEFERIVADDFAQAPRDETWLVWMVMLAEICAYLADVRYAPRLYELLAPYAARNVVLELNACYGAVSRYLGLLATTMRRFDEANTQFTRALELNQRMGARPFVARTQCEYAAMLLLRDQAGDREKAAKLLEAAVATASALAMASLAEKARALLNKPVVGATAAGPEAAAAAPVDNIFRREGDFWTVAYDGEIFRLRDIKGLGYIAHLLGQPETEVHALELMASIAPPVPEDPGARAAGDVMGAMTEEQLGELGLRHGAPDDAGEMLDSEAKAAYKRRLDELSEELEDAEQFQDVERAEKIREEKDALAKELRRAVGLGGRDRRAASISERARLNVTRAIKSAIERIAENNAGLGRMLAKTIKTGTFCSYVPDPREPIFWQL